MNHYLTQQGKARLTVVLDVSPSDWEPRVRAPFAAAPPANITANEQIRINMKNIFPTEMGTRKP